MTNKTTPKLTAAQERTWKLVLEWHSKYVHNSSNPPEGFVPGGAPSWAKVSELWIAGSEPTFKALVNKGLLVDMGKRRPGSRYNRYTIHPDFVPEYFDDEPAAPAPEPAPAVTPVENHVEVVLPADMLWVDVDDANYDRDATESGFIRKLTTTLQDYGFTVNASFGAVVSTQLTHANGDPVGGWDYDTMHALIDATKCDYVAAAPAPVNNAPEFMLGDNVTPKEGEWAGRLCWICDIRHTGVTPMYLIRDKHGKWDTWFGAEELVMVADPANYQKPTPGEPEAKFKVGDEVYLKDNPQKRVIGTVNPDGTYGLRTMSGGTGWTDYTADQLTPARDANIPFADMNAYERIILVAAETNARLEARVKELEGDMERLAASELELVQQNTLLNSVVDRLGERAATLETENTELKAQLAENHIQTAEERAADWGKWNKGN